MLQNLRDRLREVREIRRDSFALGYAAGLTTIGIPAGIALALMFALCIDGRNGSGEHTWLEVVPNSLITDVSSEVPVTVLVFGKNQVQPFTFTWTSIGGDIVPKDRTGDNRAVWTAPGYATDGIIRVLAEDGNNDSFWGEATVRVVN